MSWILRLCTMNIKRRRVRTILTVLGVSIGVISVVSLLAVGIGVKELLLKPYETGDTVRRIEVYSSQSMHRKSKMLTDKKKKDFEKISHVQTVYPVYEIYPEVSQGKYISYTSVVGIPREQLEQMAMVDGSKPTFSRNKREFILGNGVSSMLFNSSEISMYDAEKRDTVSLLGKKMEMEWTMLNSDQNLVTRKDKWTVAGVLEGDQKDYNEDSQTIFCELEALKSYLKKNSADGKLYGQPLDEDGQPLKDFVYNKMIVIVDDINEVDAMVKKFQDMGYQTYNQKELLDEGKKTTKTMQMLLGAIGMIALVVAVIGVGNTMTTAVYDRLNEIGVLKVLGCDLDELRLMFLIESGIIGALGGVCGCAISLLIRGLLNQVGIRMLELEVEKGTQLVIMPWWLILSAIFAATILGIVAGYLPARWASKLNPLEAVTK